MHLPLSPDRRSKKWLVYLALNMANVLIISVPCCSELQTSDSWTNWQGNKAKHCCCRRKHSFWSNYKSEFHSPLDYANTNYNFFTKQGESNLSFDLLLGIELLKTAGLGWYRSDNLCYLARVLCSAMPFLRHTIYIHISSFQFKAAFIIQQSEFNRKIAAAFPAVSRIRRASLSFLANSPMRCFQSLKNILRILLDK